MKLLLGHFVARVGMTAVGLAADGGGLGLNRIPEHFTFATPHGTEVLDLYRPEQRGSYPKPCLIWIHGGGGDKADDRERKISVAVANGGYVCASINFGPDRISAENILACKSAIRFMRSQSKQLGIDPNRIGVGGASLGGYLALMAGLSGRNAAFALRGVYDGVSDAVSVIIDFYGPTDFLTIPAKQRPSNVRNLPLSAYAEKAQEFSPVNYVSVSSPSILICHGKLDANVEYQQATELDRVLNTFGVRHELILLNDAGHGFDFARWGKIELQRDLTHEVLAFLDNNLAP